MKEPVIFVEVVRQAEQPSSKLSREFAYVEGDRRHCTKEPSELDGALPLMMTVGSMVLLEVQLEVL